MRTNMAVLWRLESQAAMMLAALLCFFLQTKDGRPWTRFRRRGPHQLLCPAMIIVRKSLISDCLRAILLKTELTAGAGRVSPRQGSDRQGQRRFRVREPRSRISSDDAFWEETGQVSLIFLFFSLIEKATSSSNLLYVS